MFQDPDDVVEIRVISSNNRIDAGYFDLKDGTAIRKAIASVNGDAEGVYFILNKLDRALLARAANRIKRAKETTKDSNIVERRWLYIDIDVRRPAGISSTEEEHQAAIAYAERIKDFLMARGWPEPIMVDSGNGSHLYYRLPAVALDQAGDALVKRCLEALAAKFNDARIKIDTITDNRARITKLPGTIARKGDSTPERPHRMARILEEPERVESVAIELLEQLAADASTPDPPPQKERPRDGTGSNSKFDIDTWLANSGLQIRRGPETYEGGRRWVLDCPFNSDHTKSAAVIQWPGGALQFNCKHDSCQEKDWHALRNLVEPNRKRHSPRADGATPPPGNFRVSDAGVFRVKPSEGAEGEKLIKLSARVDVVAKTKDAAGGNCGRLLRWLDDEGRPHEWPMPMELLASDCSAIRAYLLSEGLPYLATSRAAREYFAEYLQTAPVEEKRLCVDRVGWHGDTYVLPDVCIGPQASSIVLQGRQDAARWRASGSAADWRGNVGKLCAGNSRLIFAVSCAFAGPLLALVGGECGGIHFVGPTSTGKTTALTAAASVCGPPGFIQTWRSTANGLEAFAQAHSDATLFLDEIAQIEPEDAAKTAYMLGNGEGKLRMAKTITARPRLAWRLIYISTGEQTLSEHAGSAGRKLKGGAEVRLLNIPSDAGKGFGIFENLHGHVSADEFSRALRDAAAKYYGTPFRVFLEKLADDRKDIAEQVRAIRQAFVRERANGSTGEVKRACERFALISAAGTLATGFDLTGWGRREAYEAAVRCFQDWLSERETAGPSDDEKAVQQVRLFLERHGASRFQLTWDAADEEAAEKQEELAIRDRAGFRRRGEDGQIEYLVFPETFRKEVCAGLAWKPVLKVLHSRKFLRNDEGHMTRVARLPQLGLRRVYCICSLIFDAPPKKDGEEET